VTAASSGTHKIFVVEILTEHCQICAQNNKKQHNCSKNYDGCSGGMEVEGALNIWSH
jgi:hypothetical protein